MGYESCYGVRKEEIVGEDNDYCIFIVKVLVYLFYFLFYINLIVNNI